MTTHSKQGTDKWFEDRLGKVTASRISAVMAEGSGATQKNYMAQLICERLTKKREQTFTSSAMQRGNELEQDAREIYILNNFDVEVVEVGFIDHPYINMAGASPDGFVNNDGLIEIKCPNTSTHLDFLETSQPKREYILQMQWQMMCTRRKWCDFVSYDDRLPDNLSFKSVRVKFDEALSEKIEIEVIRFLSELDTKLEKIKKGMFV